MVLKLNDFYDFWTIFLFLPGYTIVTPFDIHDTPSTCCTLFA